MGLWKPKEIIVHEKVVNDPVTLFFQKNCPKVPVRRTSSGEPTKVADQSRILRATKGKGLYKTLMAAKDVVYIGPASADVVDTFEVSDGRMMCPHFERLKLGSNGCFYRCEWCYLRLTFRELYPFISIRAEYEKIKAQLTRKLSKSEKPIMWNTGELADSLSMEHLTRAAAEFIPFFGQTEKGYLYMLTKSANVDGILGLDHNKHTIVTWSMNNDAVSKKYEIGAPSFAARLEAARKVQSAGYRVRIRLDPVVPIRGWQRAYRKTIREIFSTIQPERITLGTLRFEQGFYNRSEDIFSPERRSDLQAYLSKMVPMFPAKQVGTRESEGKYSFRHKRRVAIFRPLIEEIRKIDPHIPIALCKESPQVWKELGLDLSHCQCVCQLDFADMTAKLKERKETNPEYPKKGGAQRFHGEATACQEPAMQRTYAEIPLDAIEIGDQVRREQGGSRDTLKALAASIEKQELLHPVIVTPQSPPCNNEFLLLAGSRRHEAFKNLGRTSIPAIVLKGELKAGDRIAIQLIENLQREELCPLDEAEAYLRFYRGKTGQSDIGAEALRKMMIKYEIRPESVRKKTERETVSTIVKLSGKSCRTVQNLLTLLRLKPKVQDAMRQKKITLTQGYKLAKNEEEFSSILDDFGSGKKGADKKGKPSRPFIARLEALRTEVEWQLRIGTLSRTEIGSLLTEIDLLRDCLRKAMGIKMKAQRGKSVSARPTIPL